MADDITSAAHERGSDGDLLTVTRTVDVHGEEYELDIYPATTGQRNEWAEKLRDAPEDLPDEMEAELFDEFLDYEPEDFNKAESWSDVRPAITDAAGEVILAEIFDTPQDEFREALEDVTAEVTAGLGNGD